jgi:hypothetical protein
MGPRRLATALAAAATLSLAACTSVVGGAGQSVAGANGPSGFPSASAPAGPTASVPGFPAPSASQPAPSASQPGPSSAAPPSVSCPTVTFPAAHLSFACIDNGLTQSDDPLWPLSLVKQVEPHWQLAEGAGLFGSADGHSLQTITEAVRSQMVQGGAYGPDPAVQTLSSKAATIGGAAAWVLQTQVTINAAYRQRQQLTVTHERLWIVAITIAPNDVSLWFVTVPDDVSSLWGKVPGVIDGIRVG